MFPAMPIDAEEIACTPVPLAEDGFNAACKLPFGLATGHVRNAMAEFLDFLGFVNGQLRTKGIPRFETMLMPANFSSMVGAQLEKKDWKFSGRSATSRRTITASVTRTGYEKMIGNWVYKDPSFKPRSLRKDELSKAE